MDALEIAKISKALLDSAFDSPALTYFLGQLGHTVNADRAYVFENETTAEGRVLTYQRYEWNSGVSEDQIDNPDLQGLDMTELLPHWLEHFVRGDTYFGVVRELTPADQEILGPQEIQSILVCPITVANEVWGFVGFDDCQRERRWAEKEIRILSHASRALAAALRHHDLKQRLSAARNALKSTIYEAERSQE